ncbi:hypothetical protein [Amycolatopsis sp. NPDC021455]|uniref:hypothetical protein n=1 Tax=Amycolatopsis sp. NPDC021455 TaxID=3154901 RepID=UPI0033EE3F95
MSAEPQPIGSQAEVRPYSQASRAGYGLLWTAWTILLTIGGFVLFAQSSVFAGLISLGLAALALRYTWRIWTWQARRLIFFIVF